MVVEITKGFKNECKNKHYIVYDNVGLKSTEIFRKIMFYLEFETKFEDIEEIITTVSKDCRSKCEVYYYDDKIEIFKPNKNIFPEILITKL